MKKRSKVVLISIATVLLFIGVLFFVYVSDYYKADSQAISVMALDVKNNKVTKDGNLTIFHANKDEGSAIIFYPGGKVEASAYYPLLSKIAKNGITCVLVKMPFHLAVFNSNAADQVFKKLPKIKHWYIGGHSLGGAMASSYMSKNQEKLKGLILLGAYIYGDIDPDKVLTIYGSNDQVLNKAKITYDQNIVVVNGGNHAYYGNYGEQKGDGKATISRNKQQKIVVKEIIEFINN